MANLGNLTLDLVAKIGQYVEPLNTAERKTKAASSSMVKEIDSVTTAMQRQQNAAEKTTQVIGFFASSAKALAGGITVSTMVDIADGYGQMAAQIEIATKVTDDAAKSAEKYNYVQERLLKTANTTYRPLKEAQQVYLDVGGALEKVGYTTEQTLNITDSMSFAFTANATAADKATSATNAITSSIIKNKVEANSWSSIMAAIPTITADLAKQTGKTEQEILKLGATGKLSAKDLAAAFEVSRDKNEELANSMRNSAKDGFVRLANAATVYIGKLNETSGATNTFAAGLSFLGENIEYVANAGMVVGAVYAGRVVSGLTLSALATIASTIATQKKILADYEVAKAELAATAAMVRAMKVTNEETVALMANARATYQKAAAAKSAALAGTTLSSVGKGMLGVFGGPLGLGIAAATVATGFLMMKDSSDKAKPALVDQGLTIGDLTKKYISLNEEQRNFEQSKLREKIEEDTVAIKKAGGEYYNLTVAMRNAWSTEQMTAYKELVEEITVKGLETNDAFVKIKSTGLFSQKELDEISKYNVGFSDANKTLKDHQKTLDTLEKKNKEVTKSQKDQKNAVNDLAKSYADLTDQQQKSIDKLNRSLEVDAYNKLFVASGGEIERAEHYQKYKAEAGMKPNDLLSNYERGVLDKDFYSKNYNFSDSDRKKMAGALAYVIKHSLENLAKANGLPPNLLAGLIAAESGGRDLTSKTGATGVWQTTGAFRKEYADILKKGNYSDQAYAMAAITHLKKGYKEFGNWEDALMSYNGGVEGTKALKAGRISNKVKTLGGSQVINGLRYQSPAKASEMLNYPALRYTAGLNGSSKADPSMSMPYQEDILKLQNDAVIAKQSSDDAKKAMEMRLSTPLKQMDLENKETVKSINETFADQPEKLKEMLARNQTIYQAARTQLILDTENEYKEYFTFEKDRITQITESYDKEKSYLVTNNNLTVDQRQKASDALERQKQSEIEAVKLEEKQQILQAQELYLSETEIVMKRYQFERDEIAKNIQLTKETRESLLKLYDQSIGGQMDRNSQKIDDVHYQSLDYLYRKKQPDKAAWSDLQGQYNDDQGGLDRAYSEQRSGIFLGINDEEERNAQLLAAHEGYLQAKAALNDKYDEEEKDLKQAQLDMQLASAESGFGSMTEMLRKSGDERSGIYRAMLVAEKSVAIARSIMAIQTGIAEASANPFPYNIGAMASVAAATASIVSNIQAVSAGFYDGGYTGDGGKYTAAGIVHKGEVVWSQDDITRWGGVANVEAMRLGRSLGGYSDGGIVGSTSTKSFPNIDLSAQQPQIIINTPPGMSARTEQRDGKTYVTIEEVRDYLGQQVSSPNSQFSKSMRQNYEVKPRR